MKTRTCLSVLIASCFLHSMAGAGQLNDTGQVACYDASGTATGTVSPGTPDPEAAGFDGQDCTGGAAAVDAIGQQTKLGGSSVRGRDYSKISNSGAVLPDSAAFGSGPNDWGCTRDNITGLVWELRSDDAASRRHKNNRFTWGSTGNPEGNTCNGTAATDCDTDSYVSHVRSVAHCGANDWRLPTPTELESLLAYDDPAGTNNQIDRLWFPDLSSLSFGDILFWTDTEAPFDDTAAWNVTFRYAWVNFGSKDSAIYTRLVRGATPATAPGPFSESQSVAGQPVVTDARTGLMWKKCAQGLSGATCGTGIESTMNWSEALTEAAGESHAGFNDWRLPTSFELSALRNYASNQALGTVFSAAGSTAYWSSTTAPRGGGAAILALSHTFGEFSAHADSDKTEFLAVRLVRGGSHLAAATSTQLDFTPDPFVLDPVSAAADTQVESNSITVQGVASVTTVLVSGAADSEYSVNGGGFTRVVGGVRNGDTVTVRHRTGSSGGAMVTTTLNIGGVTAEFVSTVSATPPSAPTGVVATRGNASATLTFNAPDSDGGSPITGYTAISNPAGGISNCAAPPALSCTVTSLTNGQPYTFTVTASNSAGSGSPSAPSNPVTPATVPGAPTGVSATAQNGQATVSFTAPASNGGSPILDYTATSVEGGGTGTCSTSPCTVAGLSNGTPYTFTVRARNAVGQGPASAPSNEVRLSAPPTISFEGTPRTQFPLNHNGFFFILLRNPDITLVVDDADSAPGSLTVEVASSNPGLLPAVPDDELAGVHLSTGDANAPQKRPVTIRPAFNQAGSVTLTFTVRDPEGLSSSVQLSLEIQDANRFPFAAYLAQTVRLPANAQPGLFEVPGLLVSASPGEGEALAQVVNHQFLVETLSFGADVTATVAPSFDPFSGNFRFTLPPGDNVLRVYTWPTDTGTGDLARCTGANKRSYMSQFLDFIRSRYTIGALRYYPPPDVLGPCGMVWELFVVPQDIRHALLGVERSARRRVAASKSASASVDVDYTIRLNNTGTLPIESVVISAPESGQLGRAPWTCTTTHGACVPASGQGAIRTTVDLDLDEEAVIVIAASLSDSTTYVAITPTVSFAEGVTGFVFGNGVQRIDAISNDFISLGNFEGADP